MNKMIWLFALGSLVTGSAHAINKCVDASGQTAYQEEPCAATAKATRFQSWDVQGASPDKSPAAAIQALKERAIDMAGDRRLREIAHEVEGMQREIDEYQRGKDYYILRARNREDQSNIIMYFDAKILDVRHRMSRLEIEAQNLRNDRMALRQNP